MEKIEKRTRNDYLVNAYNLKLKDLVEDEINLAVLERTDGEKVVMYDQVIDQGRQVNKPVTARELKERIESTMESKKDNLRVIERLIAAKA
jgi:hypothetical protein